MICSLVSAYKLAQGYAPQQASQMHLYYQIHKIGAMLLYTVVFYCYAFVWLLKGNHLQSEQAYY